MYLSIIEDKEFFVFLYTNQCAGNDICLSVQYVYTLHLSGYFNFTKPFSNNLKQMYEYMVKKVPLGDIMHLVEENLDANDIEKERIVRAFKKQTIL